MLPGADLCCLGQALANELLALSAANSPQVGGDNCSGFTMLSQDTPYRVWALKQWRPLACMDLHSEQRYIVCATSRRVPDSGATLCGPRASWGVWCSTCVCWVTVADTTTLNLVVLGMAACAEHLRKLCPYCAVPAHGSGNHQHHLWLGPLPEPAGCLLCHHLCQRLAEQLLPAGHCICL